MEVKLIFKGKYYFYEVKSGDKTYTVSIQVNCDCRYMSVQGLANKKICKHIRAVLQEIINE